MRKRPPTESASALIIAGGRGTRFWPVSRGVSPKPLFSLDGRRSLLAATVERLRPVIGLERIFVLVSEDQRDAFRRGIRGLVAPRNLIVEPEGRGTAVAVAFGAAAIERRLGPGTLAVIPADHHVHPASGFRTTIRRAIRLAGTERAIVVIGVEPTRAEPGFGYQKIGRSVGAGFKVERFIEKPDARRARRMVRSGRYLWNAGMFVMTNETLERELNLHAPGLAEAGRRLPGLSARALSRAYRALDFDSFDRVIAERSREVLSVRAAFRWHDVGSWEGLWEAVRNGRPNVQRGRVIALESDGVLAHSSGRLMVLFGMRDVIAVDTGDAILIADRKRSQDIRRVTEELRRRRLHRYL